MAMRQIWGWNLLASTLVAVSFLLIDSSFLIANLVKVMEGGYIPLMLAAIVCGVMLIWNRGVKATSRAINEKVMAVDEFFNKINRLKVPRVQGTAVFLTRSQNGVPPVMRWHVARNRALQQQVISLTNGFQYNFTSYFGMDVGIIIPSVFVITAQWSFR